MDNRRGLAPLSGHWRWAASVAPPDDRRAKNTL